MSRSVRVVVGLLAALLFPWMLVLLVKSPTFKTSGYGDPVVTMECGSVLTVGWPSDHEVLMDTNGGGFYADHVVSGPSLTTEQRAGLARSCSERRDTYLGIMTFLAVPTCILGAAAVVGRPRRVS